MRGTSYIGLRELAELARDYHRTLDGTTADCLVASLREVMVRVNEALT